MAVKQKNHLLNLVLYDKEYRKNYILYKAKVEKRYPPKNLLKQLPFEIKMEMIITWEREIRKVRR